MESSPEPPQVVFHTVEQSQGLQRVQQARLLVDSSSAALDRWKQQPA
jgi:hypothetical protein